MSGIGHTWIERNASGEWEVLRITGYGRDGSVHVVVRVYPTREQARKARKVRP